MARIFINGDPNASSNGGGGFKSKTPGMYDLRIDSKERAQGGKAPKLVLKATIISADNGQHVGDVVTLHESLSEKMAWRWRQVLDATGVNYQSGPQGTGIDFDDDHLVGRCFRAKLTLEPRETGSGHWERWNDLQPSRFNPANQQQAPAPVAPHQGYPAPVQAPTQQVAPAQTAQAVPVPGQQPMQYPPGYMPPQAR